MHPSVLLLFAASVILLRLLYSFSRCFTLFERSIPGPWLARFSKLWYFLHVRSGNFHNENIALHAKYGPVVRVGPGLYSINQPDKSVYGIGSKFEKSDWYEGWKHPSPDRWTLFPDRDIERHSATRKRFQNLYSMSSLVSYEKYVEQCMTLFLQKMSSWSLTGETVDMAHWFQCYAFDVMGDITYSERFGFLDQGEDVAGMIAALDNAMVYSTLAGVYAWAHPYLYTIMEKLPGSGAAGRNYLMKFVRQKIEERDDKRNLSKHDGKPAHVKAHVTMDTPRDFLDKLNDAHEQDPTRVTPYHIFMMGLSNIIAGSDTTAVSLSSILYNLIRHPCTIARLRQEIKEHDEQKQSEGDFVTFKEATTMPYLQAVIKEGLRLHPATGLPLWRVVPEGGAFIAGRHFPAGATVGLNSWVAHYDPNVFAPDAHVFRPERWLEAEEEKGTRLKEMEANYMPFGLGSRTCLGRHISTLEMSKLVPEMVKRFDFELDMPDMEWKTKNFWFVKPVDFNIRVKARSE